MPNFALSRLERLYTQVESTFGTIPNSTGTATVAASNACRLIKFDVANKAALIERPDKTGTRSKMVGVLGRKHATWSAEMSLAPNGVAGVVPDCDPLLQAIFGQASTIVADTSCTYSLVDAIKSLSMWSFRQPSTIDQRVIHGAVAQEMTIEAGADVAMIKFNGEGIWALEKNQFSVADVTQKGGLTAFPSEPGSPVTNGGMIVGFTGSIVVDGHTLVTLRTATVKVTTGNVTVKDTFGTYYPDSPEGDERNVSIDMSIYEDDSDGYADLMAISNDKTPVTITLTLGTVAGSICTVTLGSVQLQSPDHEEQRRYITNWSGSTAHGSTLALRDELSIAFT